MYVARPVSHLVIAAVAQELRVLGMGLIAPHLKLFATAQIANVSAAAAAAVLIFSRDSALPADAAVAAL